MIFQSIGQIFPNKELKIIASYTLFAILYCLIHLILTSVFSFFHFLLDHDLATVNNWLSLNSWEIISFSKLSAVLVMVKLFQFNSYGDNYFWASIGEYFKSPSKKIFVIIFFVLAILYALIEQFGGGIRSNSLFENLMLSSFLGSFVFYAADFVFLIYLFNYFDYTLSQSIGKHIDGATLLIFFILGLVFLLGTIDFFDEKVLGLSNSMNSLLLENNLSSKWNLFEIDKVKAFSMLIYAISFVLYVKSSFSKNLFLHFSSALTLLFIFTFFSKLILPYLDKYLLFLVIHFVFLFFLLERMQTVDMGFYLLGIVSLLSVFFGIDLVWDNSYSMFEYSKNLPVIGIIGIWFIALQYYKLSRLN